MKRISYILLLFFFTSTSAQNKIFNNDSSDKGSFIMQVFSYSDLNIIKNNSNIMRFSISRAHLGYKYAFNNEFLANIIIDAGRPTMINQAIVYDSNGYEIKGNYSQGSYYSMALKFASIEWKPNNFFKIQAGGILQNHYITQERFWGQRFVFPTFQDIYFGIPSGDFGFISFIKINNKFKLDFALTNGEGFRFDQDPTGNLKYSFGLDFLPFNKFETRIFYDITNPKLKSQSIQELYSFFAGYKGINKLKIGFEYNYRKNSLFITNNNLHGYSIYSIYSINPKLNIFARYDNINSTKLIDLTESESIQNHTIISGITYTPTKGLYLSLNYQRWNKTQVSPTPENHIQFNIEFNNF